MCYYFNKCIYKVSFKSPPKIEIPKNTCRWMETTFRRIKISNFIGLKSRD